MTSLVHHARIYCLNARPTIAGPVVYWMSRDQRSRDNWALLYAQQHALERRARLAVVFCLAPAFLGAPWRAYSFMLRGLRETAQHLAEKNIPFFLLRGDPAEEIPAFVRATGCGTVVTDFDPLRIKRTWKHQVAQRLAVPLYEVDTHNIVPCRYASDRQEYSAATLRPKLMRLLPEFLVEFPKLKAMPRSNMVWHTSRHNGDWDEVFRSVVADRSVGEVLWCRPGERAALAALRQFIRTRLAGYPVRRNDPCCDGQSGLSPYLHFGQLAAQRVARAVQNADAPSSAKQAFLEELIVRRELADNFCFYNQHYDDVTGFPQWARETLNNHSRDPRPYLYTYEQFDNSLTHDPLWNAAQRQMVVTGKMHGYLRMYWCKKILEWTPSPETALAIAIRLNDRYELDGRDPNGYAGIAWSIGGVHDRPWPQRSIFGSVRYMSAAGCAKKFDVAAFIQRYIGDAGFVAIRKKIW